MLRSFVEILPFQSFQLLFTTKFYKLITGSIVSAMLILPVTFAPLTSFHASKWGAGHSKGFSSFGPYRENSSSLAKYALTICYYRTFTLLYFELCLSVIQAANQSIHTRQTFSLGRGLERMQAKMIIYSTREKQVRGVFIEAVAHSSS